MQKVTLLIAIFFSASMQAESLCFGPVKEKSGDKATERSFWQSFDYKVQVDDGPIIEPSDTKSTSYKYNTKNPMVKIYLGKKLVESFSVDSQLLKEGRNCVYFKNTYETWSVLESWQAKKLCSC